MKRRLLQSALCSSMRDRDSSGTPQRLFRSEEYSEIKFPLKRVEQSGTR